jgi:hypothetical protein
LTSVTESVTTTVNVSTSFSGTTQSTVSEEIALSESFQTGKFNLETVKSSENFSVVTEKDVDVTLVTKNSLNSTAVTVSEQSTSRENVQSHGTKKICNTTKNVTSGPGPKVKVTTVKPVTRATRYTVRSTRYPLTTTKPTPSPTCPPCYCICTRKEVLLPSHSTVTSVSDKSVTTREVVPTQTNTVTGTITTPPNMPLSLSVSEKTLLPQVDTVTTTPYIPAHTVTATPYIPIIFPTSPQQQQLYFGQSATSPNEMRGSIDSNKPQLKEESNEMYLMAYFGGKLKNIYFFLNQL